MGSTESKEVKKSAVQTSSRQQETVNRTMGSSSVSSHIYSGQDPLESSFNNSGKKTMEYAGQTSSRQQETVNRTIGSSSVSSHIYRGQDPLESSFNNSRKKTMEYAGQTSSRQQETVNRTMGSSSVSSHIYRGQDPLESSFNNSGKKAMGSAVQASSRQKVSGPSSYLYPEIESLSLENPSCSTAAYKPQLNTTTSEVSSVENLISSLMIADNAIILKPRCVSCKASKEAFRSLKQNYMILDLDERSDAFVILDQLRKRTGDSKLNFPIGLRRGHSVSGDCFEGYIHEIGQLFLDSKLVEVIEKNKDANISPTAPCLPQSSSGDGDNSAKEKRKGRNRKDKKQNLGVKTLDSQLSGDKNEAPKVKKKGAGPPDRYICNICFGKGHFIEACPLKKPNNDYLTPYQGNNVCFGEFWCSDCNKKWTSVKSRANTPETCVSCGQRVYPHIQRPLKPTTGKANNTRIPQKKKAKATGTEQKADKIPSLLQ